MKKGFYTIIAARLVMFALASNSHSVHRVVSSDAIATARPDILDRNGEVLATDVRVPSLYAEPRRLIDADEAIEVYRRFRVPEVWVCDEDELRILVLQANGRYAESATSASFPFLAAAEIDAIKPVLRDVVAWKASDPHMSAAEQDRMWEVCKQAGGGSPT